MKNFKIIFLLLCLNTGLVTGCSDYLDIVPDNIVTEADVFGSRQNVEKFLKTCYGYLPSVVRPFHDPNWIASRSDEIWFYPDGGQFPPLGTGDTPMGLAIMNGGQNATNPYVDYWDGGRAGKFLWGGIRECNVFLENVEENRAIPDIKEEERVWWIGEVKFLKAYYHFYLMHLYGPIPIVRRNPPISASPEEVRVYREPIDDVVNYIVELIEEAEVSLTAAGSDKLMKDNNSAEYGGRITTSIAKAVKAKVLVWAASRLFNGNEFYSGFMDSRNRQLIPDGEPDVKKWDRAAKACREALDWIEEGQYHQLYGEGATSVPSGVAEETRMKYLLRYAVTDLFNREIIWPSTHPVNGFNGSGIQDNLWQMNLTRESMPTFMLMASSGTAVHCGSIGTTLNMAEMFYTRNGLPIEDDEEWQRYVGGMESRYNTRQVTDDGYHRNYLRTGAVTAQLNFLREPRFYAYVGFDGGIWEGAGRAENESFWVNKNSSLLGSGRNVPTGYYMKKVVHPDSYFSPAGTAYSVQSEPYSFPYMRLSELYLLYAEALNEAEGPNGPNSGDLFKYIDAVRTRAGLQGVKATWDQAASARKGRYSDQAGMRDIIRRERTVELCFEGKRGEDVRRWRIAHEEFSKPIRGWNGPYQTTNEGYYRVVNHYNRTYTLKDYLWPIKSSNIDVNRNLVQNPGW
jgi:hypothetical protein